MAVGLEHVLHAGQHFLAERREVGPAMVDGREVDRAQDAVGHVGRARDLEEVAAGGSRHSVAHSHAMQFCVHHRGCALRNAIIFVFCIQKCQTHASNSAPISADRAALHEEVVDRLRDLIVQGQLAPGTRLNERVLCEQLGISRTPLREALKLLATEGLVELLPNRGAHRRAARARAPGRDARR